MGSAASPLMQKVAVVAHRYALGKGKQESNRDRLTWHTLVVVEWDHGKNVTVIELANLNGVGGRRGKSNWCLDMDEPVPALYRSMAEAMIAPFRNEAAELRVVDHPAANINVFMQYMNEKTGMEKLFLDPQKQHEAPVRIHFNAQRDLVNYLSNYIGRDTRYTQEFRNCQDFAADIFGFLAGKSGIEPFSPICRAGYTNRSHMFLYAPDKFDQHRPELA